MNTDQQLYKLSHLVYQECVDELHRMKRSGSTYDDMRAYVARFPQLHTRHLAILTWLINRWEDYYSATGLRFSGSPAPEGDKNTTKTPYLLYFFKKITLGKKWKKKWTFGLTAYKLFKKSVLGQSTYQSSSDQKSKSPKKENQSKSVQTHLDCLGDLQSIDKQLVMGGKKRPVQKSTFFRRF